MMAVDVLAWDKRTLSVCQISRQEICCPVPCHTELDNSSRTGHCL